MTAFEQDHVANKSKETIRLFDAERADSPYQYGHLGHRIDCHLFTEDYCDAVSKCWARFGLSFGGWPILMRKAA